MSWLAFGCNSDGAATPLRVGREPGPASIAAADGGRNPAGSTAEFAGNGGLVPPGGPEESLRVHVENPAGLTLEIVTLQCAGDCADLQAVARGGNEPYAFEWEDGSTSAARRVCLAAPATLSVRASDTAIDSAEFHHSAQTATANVAAQVRACADAGVPLADAATTQECQDIPLTGLPPSCPVTGVNGVITPIGNVALHAGVPIAFRTQGAGNFVTGEGWNYEVWGSSDGCALDELLGSFQLKNGPFDFKTCAKPLRDHARVLLFYRIAATDGLSLSTFSSSVCGSCE
jgi:hypothetical protein